MTLYERRCRLLLRAFPVEYREQRGEEIVGVLLDTGPAGQRWPSWATTTDLIGAGMRVRGRIASSGRASIAVIEGMRLAAIVGLCVQAAFSLAMVVHHARESMLFYLTYNAWSTTSLALLAGIWVIAFVLVVAGWPRLAVLPALIGSAGNVILFVSNFHGNRGNPASVLLIGAEMTLLGLVPTIALVAASTRRAPPTGRRNRSPVWFVAGAALTAVFSALSTGIHVTPGGTSLSYPAAGGVVTCLFWMCLVALFVMVFASALDPRLGVAVIVVSLPIVIYQVGLLVSVAKPTWPVLAALAAFATAVVVAISSGISLRRLRA